MDDFDRSARTKILMICALDGFVSSFANSAAPPKTIPKWRHCVYSLHRVLERNNDCNWLEKQPAAFWSFDRSDVIALRTHARWRTSPAWSPRRRPKRCTSLYLSSIVGKCKIYSPPSAVSCLYCIYWFCVLAIAVLFAFFSIGPHMSGACPVPTQKGEGRER